MLVAQCCVLSPDAQTHETFRCSYTQIIGAVKTQIYISNRKPRWACIEGAYAGPKLLQKVLQACCFRLSTPINKEISEIRKIDQGKGQKVF